MTARLCLFCGADGPFNTREHVIPESLGNDDLIVEHLLCDVCQNYIGKEIESFVLSKTSFAFWKVWYGVKSKKGWLPSVDFSLPQKNKGRLPAMSQLHDQHIGFTAHQDGTISADIEDDAVVQKIVDNEKHCFRFDLSPKHIAMIGRFVGKIGMELTAIADKEKAIAEEYDSIREYVRYGVSQSLWPLLHGSLETRLDRWKRDPSNRNTEERTIYRYALVETGPYSAILFDIGSERWGIILNAQFPHPQINKALRNAECNDLRFIWYHDHEWKK